MNIVNPLLRLNGSALFIECKAACPKFPRGGESKGAKSLESFKPEHLFLYEISLEETYICTFTIRLQNCDCPLNFCPVCLFVCFPPHTPLLSSRGMPGTLSPTPRTRHLSCGTYGNSLAVRV